MKIRVALDSMLHVRLNTSPDVHLSNSNRSPSAAGACLMLNRPVWPHL